MSEPAKVRLVRCPKCENLLPELTDYSVYQCGGCGTVLRVTAKNKNGELNKFVEKSEDETVGGIVEKRENIDLSEKKLMNMADGSGYDVKSNTSSSSTRERRRALRDAPETYRTSLRNVADNWANEDGRVMYKTNIDEHSQENMANEFEPFDSQNGKEIETRRTGRVPYRSSRERSAAEMLPRARRVDLEGIRYSSSINSEDGILGYSSDSIYDSDKRLYRKDVDGFSQDEQIQENMAKEFELFDSQKGKEIETRSTGRVPNWRSKERSEAEVLPRARRVDPKGMRYASSINSEEGPSGYWSGSNYDNDKRLYRKDVDGFSQVDCPVDERAELLRKFDELKEKLSRFGDVSEKPNERVPLERRMAHHEGYGNPVDRFPESSTRIMNRALAQNPVSAEKPPYLNHYNVPSPFMNVHDMDGGGFYPPRDHIHGYGGPRRSQLLSGDPHQATALFQLQPSLAHFPGRSMDNEISPMDPYRPYLPQTNPHHPSCNCFHCCDVNQIRSRGPPTAFGEKRFSDISQNPMFYGHQNSGAFGKQDYNPRNANPLPLKPQKMAHSGDLNSAVGGYARRHPPRVQPSRQQCLPVAGGAPFFTCFKCFQLLKLPKDVFNGGKRRKMKCGACSTVMVIAVSDNKLAVSIDERVDKSTDKMGPQHRVMLNEGNRYSNGQTNRPSMTFSSEDYDTSRYDFHAMDQELRSLSTGRGSSLKSAEMRSLCSTSSRSSREEENLNKSAATMEKSDSEQPMKGKESPPPAGSPLQEYFDYSNKYHVANRLDHGNRSARSDAEKLMQKKTASQQNSTKDLAVATEMDIPSNEYGNTGSSLGSGESSKGGDQLKATKESFFSGIIKKSFKEFSRSDSAEEEKANTTVNGNLIPDRLIKKAEKRAGPIQPGHYWYDFRAGFWGVTGGPCLGIIPPFIEEFNYPMPDNCAGGSTGVFVNGRELHAKDLKLLASRGLPAERDRSYILEISGRVLDEDSGEELESLGKLAPTVEKAKHGFGMRPPKVAA